jgi:hypothetical protein
MSIAGPLEALPVGPAAATTVFQEDVDGGPLEALPTGQVAATTEVEENINARHGGGGCYQRIWQRPPPSLKKTSMVGLLGGTTGGSGSGHH